MTPHIRDITSNELKLFGDIIHRLQRLGAQDDVRRAVLPDLVQLLRADGGCSCTWLETNQRFSGSIYVGAAPEIPSLYDDWYQFRDPITCHLRAARRATIVDDVMDRRDLTRTEFYNDFLQRDALEWGINIYMFDQRDHDLGDFESGDGAEKQISTIERKCCWTLWSHSSDRPCCGDALTATASPLANARLPN